MEKFIQLTLEDGTYYNELGQAVTFSKYVTVRLEGEKAGFKLSFTRRVADVSIDKPLPCIKTNIDAEPVKIFLDGTLETGDVVDLQVLESCVLVSR